MLILIAGVCALITIILTLWAAFAESAHGGQSMRESMKETWVNIAIGFSINYCANLVVLPLAGLPVTPTSAIYIGVIFTAISVVRSFLIRRWYNWRMLQGK
jgi:cobalamin synthase